MIDIDISQKGRKVNLFADEHIIETPVPLRALSKIDSEIGGVRYGGFDERESEGECGEGGVAEGRGVESVEFKAVTSLALTPPYPPRLPVRDYVTQHDYSVKWNIENVKTYTGKGYTKSA